MKTLNLEKLGVQEMGANEIRKIDGGWIIEVIVGVVIGAIVTDWANFKQGIADGINGN